MVHPTQQARVTSLPPITALAPKTTRETDHQRDGLRHGGGTACAPTT